MAPSWWQLLSPSPGPPSSSPQAPTPTDLVSASSGARTCTEPNTFQGALDLQHVTYDGVTVSPFRSVQDLVIPTGIGFITGAVVALSARAIYLRRWKRIPNADWVTPDLYGRYLRGVVTRSVRL
jgi:hypothetical protein